MDAWLCREGFEDAVARELARGGARELRDARRPGVVAAELAVGAPEVDPAFASQTLPAATLVRGESVSVLARAALESVATVLDSHGGAFALHVVVPELEEPGRLASRAKLVGDELRALLKDVRRRAARRLVPHEPAPPEGAGLLHVVIVGREEALVSFAVPRPHSSGIGKEPSWWPLGRPHVGADREAPSSAYRKAEEAYLLLGREPAPGERVADVGAAPGGWSWTALKRGASVVAIDRGKLEEPVRGHERLLHLRKDAFEWEPTETFDWLFCDAIAEPERSIGLLDRWLERGWCKRFVLNVKFRPGSDYGQVAKLKAVLARRGASRARVKQLGADKNEVTTVGFC